MLAGFREALGSCVTGRGGLLTISENKEGIMIYNQVREFHEVYGCYEQTIPAMPPESVIDLRVGLIEEEMDELKAAIEARDIIGIADALGDLMYVVAGAGRAFGIPLPEVVAEIHRSNLSKLGDDGKPVLRAADQKVLKGPNYTPPDIASVLQRVSTP